MSILILFGLPGAGKTFVGKILKEKFNFFFHDGDKDLTAEMKTAIASQQPISDEMRDAFFERIISSVQNAQKIHPNLVVAQTYIKEKYRKQLKEKFSDVQFMYITAKDETREQRLKNRTEYPLDLAYARKMKAVFEPPTGEFFEIDNTPDGEEHVVQQLTSLFSRK